MPVDSRIVWEVDHDTVIGKYKCEYCGIEFEDKRVLDKPTDTNIWKAKEEISEHLTQHRHG